MTRLQWDNVGERFFEVGVDRCVLYIPEGEYGVGYPWSGVTAITESADEASTPYFLDGVKYMDVETFGEFKGMLKAFTYPSSNSLLGLPKKPGFCLMINHIRFFIFHTGPRSATTLTVLTTAIRFIFYGM